MAARPEGNLERPVPRLTVLTPLVADTTAIAAALAAMVEVVDIAAVVLRLADDSEGTLTKRIKALAPVVQINGAALLLAGRSEIVGRSGADGAHLTGIDALETALPSLKPGYIAGAGGLHTRHDAMMAAEAAADYVMFGEPGESGHRPPFEDVLDRVEWWAEVFQVPCIGFAGSLDEVAALAAAGADFVAVGEFIFADPRGPVAAALAASQLLLPEPA
jgi:thiamine-phosphate pyrophosphorylase